ncbi:MULTISPECIES: iron-containing alcohol dehydrogenase [unclassified Streptomyces]|uniref:iron-containing alcohol dehydrogenase n=1 Tax=unclassified Streptomyces TaxID=2593676 RepID=UPI00093ED461|nr:iron-containing alcohol dehydrogenase [Streptomyces sp. CB01883]OKJ74420.1 iron-containing alcohol dehydrogenase [Streptomyces sp. CB01883]
MFDFHVPTRIVFGRGRLEELGAHTRVWGDRALIVCGHSAMRTSGVLARAQEILSAAGVKADVYDRVSANPRSNEVDAAIRQARAFGARVVIGLGGGSALDAAKAVAVGIGHESVAGLVGRTLDHSSDSLPVIAVPTTAGSGAEVTKGAIVTDVVRDFKSGIRGDDLFPKVAVVDPSLTDTLPSRVALESGFDAMAHAIEGFLARRSGEMNKALSERAVELLAPALRRLAAGDTGADVRDTMAFGALMGGINVATASTCLPHRMQQAIGTAERVGPSHGYGLAMLYPAWLESVEQVAGDDAKAVARFLGATDLRHAVQSLLQDIGLTQRLSDYGYAAEDIHGFADRITGNLDNDPHPEPGRLLIESIYMRSL